MSNKVSVVMYHYVRNLQESKYPKIKGLDLPLFEEQLDYLQKNYSIVDIDTVIEAYENKAILPPKAVLLTFDDGYSDHYDNVFPILKKRKISGAFYPSVKAITEHSMLDVNKIHFILAAKENKKKLIEDIFVQLDTYRESYSLANNEFYIKKLAIAGKYDTKEVVFIKRLLQRELVESLRNIITNFLFHKYVSCDEEDFSREIYMSVEQIKHMQENEMHIGSHGFEHYWLSYLDKKNQLTEINKSLEFLKRIGGNIEKWTMCYPYGSYNNDTLNILKDKGCKLRFTTQTNVADILISNKLELPRLDTNDIPKCRHAKVDEWYYRG